MSSGEDPDTGTTTILDWIGSRRTTESNGSLRGCVLELAPELRIQSSVNDTVGKFAGIFLEAAAVTPEPRGVLSIEAQSVALAF